MKHTPTEAMKVDQLLDSVARPAVQVRVIWTAKSIGERIGRSEDFVRFRLAKIKGSPVHKIGGRYCAVEDALIEFMRWPEET